VNKYHNKIYWSFGSSPKHVSNNISSFVFRKYCPSITVSYGLLGKSWQFDVYCIH
jgi:hypothetical protein